MADKEEPKKKQSTIKQIIQIFKYTHAEDKALPWLCGGVFVAWLIAVVNRFLKLGLLSKLAERVTFVLIPPLLLIFLVLGTIFLGVATPTEGGAMGAVGALIMATLRRRLDLPLLKQALNTTTKLSSFVMFILVGATIFSMVFQAADGPVWVEHLLAKLPGGQLGFLIFVNVMIFVLAFFLDFFELSFIVVPVLAPIADKMGIDLVWFGVLLAVNMQTSFMHPPFGFALFYLRSVAPPSIKTTDIYWGAVPFVCIQIQDPRVPAVRQAVTALRAVTKKRYLYDHGGAFLSGQFHRTVTAA